MEVIKESNTMSTDQNLGIYNLGRAVPDNAKRPIAAGRLKGMTDINPMWRIYKLTEMFGPCGIGWGYSITRLWLENGAGGEVCAMAQIGLWYRDPATGDKSEPIPGIGGNKLVANEKNGPYTSDECYKMALTDAISVAAKALGIGADVYWKDGRTKYTANDAEQHPQQQPQQPQQQQPQPKAAIDRKAEYERVKHILGCNDAGFAQMRKELIERRAIVNKTFKDMTDAEYMQTLNGIVDNFHAA